MAREIHSLMQDADDIDAFGDEAVKQEVRAAGNFVVARAYVRAFLSHRRMRRYVLDALPKVAGVRLRPSGRPCNPKYRQGRFERAVIGRSGPSLGLRFLVPFARNEGLEIKRR